MQQDQGLRCVHALVLLERTHELCVPVGIEDDIWVEEYEHLATGCPGAHVVAVGVAVVDALGEQRHALVTPDALGRAVGGPIVDHDDLLGRPRLLEE